MTKTAAQQLREIDEEAPHEHDCAYDKWVAEYTSESHRRVAQGRQAARKGFALDTPIEPACNCYKSTAQPLIDAAADVVEALIAERAALAAVTKSGSYADDEIFLDARRDTDKALEQVAEQTKGDGGNNG